MFDTGRSDLRYFARKILHALEYLQPVHEKCGAFFFLASAWKSLNIIEEYEGLSLVDTSFAPRDSPRSSKKLARSPYFIGHGGQYDTKYLPFDWILRATFAGERTCVFLREQACKLKVSPYYQTHGLLQNNINIPTILVQSFYSWKPGLGEKLHGLKIERGSGGSIGAPSFRKCFRQNVLPLSQHASVTLPWPRFFSRNTRVFCDYTTKCGCNMSITRL